MVDRQVHPYNDGKGGKNSKNTKDEDIVAEVDQDLENGPVFKRKCTDIICCPLFVAFVAGMIWALGYGIANGDPWKLTTMFDYDGNGCGHASGFEDHDYIYWPDIDTSATEYSTLATRTMCVSRCPTISNQLTSSECKDNSIHNPCQSATPTPYDSKLYLNRFCIPDTSSSSSSTTYTNFYNSVMDDWGGNYVTAYMADVYI